MWLTHCPMTTVNAKVWADVKHTCLIFVPMQKNAHQLQMCPGTEPKRSITEEWSLGHRVSSCTCPQQSIIQAFYCALCDFTVKTCIETDLNCVRKLVVMRAEISATTKPVQQNLSRGVRLLECIIEVQQDRMRDLKIDVVLKVIQRFKRRSWTVKLRKDVWNPDVKALVHLQKLNYRQIDADASMTRSISYKERNRVVHVHVHPNSVSVVNVSEVITNDSLAPISMWKVWDITSF